MRRGAYAAGLAAATILLVGATDAARAAKFRRPFAQSTAVGYGFDNDAGGGGCTDYNCGATCYDGHRGSDYPIVVGTTVLAAAPGTVTFTNDGCADTGFLGSTCGGGYGNYVRIDHGDGTVSYYAHLKSGSLLVSTNDTVTCGQAIAQSASSGNSTGPHLHFELRVSGVRTDPYGGSCSQATSYWVNQNAYGSPTGDVCETTCECSTGQTENQGCGNCGTRSRTCQANCTWGAWSGCTGEGACAAGATENQACCDCGSRSRTCSGSCQWDAWSTCAGPDPGGGTQTCTTGGVGECGAGVERCVDGCLTCEAQGQTGDELCDGLDNDCDGEVDEGRPTQLGNPVPGFAARLMSSDHPVGLLPGTSRDAWAMFENVGTQTWPAGQVQLVTASSLNGLPSEMYHASWQSTGVVTTVPSDVLPGESVVLVFTVAIATQSTGNVTEHFQLVDPSGRPLDCPSPLVTIQLGTGSIPDAGVLPDGSVIADAGTADAATGLGKVTGGCRCQAQSGLPGGLPLVLLLWLAVWWVRRRATLASAHPPGRNEATKR